MTIYVITRMEDNHVTGTASYTTEEKALKAFERIVGRRWEHTIKYSCLTGMHLDDLWRTFDECMNEKDALINGTRYQVLKSHVF